MSQTRNHLPPVNATSTPHQHAEVTTQLVKQNNRQDAFKVIYAADTGSATAYVMTPTPGIKFYDVGQPYEFKALHANTTSAPTLNINGLGAGTITKQGAAALAVGDVALGDFVTVICTSATPTFQITSQVATPAILSGATTFLGGDVALNNTGAYFNGPNTGSIGANGQTWAISGTARMLDTGGQAFLNAAIFDGTNYIANCDAVNPAANQSVCIGLAPVVVALTAATTFTLRATASTATSVLKTSTVSGISTANKATFITAVRLA